MSFLVIRQIGRSINTIKGKWVYKHIIIWLEIIDLKKMFQGGDLKDQMLKSYIDQIFDKYDTDKSGTLD